MSDPNREPTDSVVKQLSFLRKGFFDSIHPSMSQLIGRLRDNGSKGDVFDRYRERLRCNLLPASNGIGWCIDERKPENSERSDKPAMAGGAAGWVFYFMMTGKSLNDVFDLTKKLYQRMNWGEMEIHTDDHGNDDHHLGCGFLNVVGKVASVVSQITGLPKPEEINGGEIYSLLKQDGAKVVVLTGPHEIEKAMFVVNLEKDTVVDRVGLHEDSVSRRYGNQRAFAWDAWATITEEVLKHFNKLSGAGLSQEDFFRLQASTHLATGILLNALRLGPNGNLVVYEGGKK